MVKPDKIRSFSSDEQFGKYLITHGYLLQNEFDRISEEFRQPGERLMDALVRAGLISAERMSVALAQFLGIPYLALSELQVDPAVAQRVTEELARRYTLIPVGLSGTSLRLAMADPTDVHALQAVNLFTGMKIEPVLAKASEIHMLIRQYLTEEKSLAQIKNLSFQVDAPNVWVMDEPGKDRRSDAPTITLVNALLQQAVEQNASDVHFESHAQEMTVRFRIDGRLEVYRILPVHIARNVISRVKVMAGMDIAERRLPQDGRIAIDIAGKQIDLRVSTMPTVYGEKVVIRILDPDQMQRSLMELGLRPEIENGMRNLIGLTHGLIVIAGPTGSGKTTTLYALMRELDTRTYNVVSIEDPIEYRLAGINQTSVQSQIGMDFARGLRAILRQDPDVIIVGEIRDEETARIAITAALTGHLVLSTIHTNNAAEAISRFLDMGIEPYLLASAISGVLSQRLVRVLCPECKILRNLSEEEKKSLHLPGRLEPIYEPSGCSLCRGAGYSGRIGIHELLLYHQEIKDLVLSRSGAKQIEQIALKNGMVSMLEDGVYKVEKGWTSIEEVLRCISDFG